MANNSLDFMKDVLASPLGELIASIGAGVGEAQAALDAGSLAQTLQIYSENDDVTLNALREIGYQPTFYALPETEVEATISLSISGVAPSDSGSNSGTTSNAKTKIYVSPLNASNTNKFNMNVNAATKLKFKIVPVPPAESIVDIRVTPDLTGKTVVEVETLLNLFSLNYQIGVDNGSGSVVTQSPNPGSLIKAGNSIEINL